MEKIRAKREVTVKTEDSDDMLLENNKDTTSSVDSACSQTNVNNAVSASDVKSVIAEYVFCCLISSSVMHVNLRSASR